MKRPLFCLLVTICATGLTHADQPTRSLQETLKQQGFYYGAITGNKTAETTAAIRRYQIRNGLKVTGEINDETTRSLSSSLPPVAAKSRGNSRYAASNVHSMGRDASSNLGQSSSPPSFDQTVRQPPTNSSYSASFYQSPPIRMTRRTISAAQYQLMRRGYYRGQIDGRYGPQTAFGLRAFQSSAGFPITGQLNMRTLDALGLSDMSFAYVAPPPTQHGTWIPVRKFKHGKWKVKWKNYYRDSGDEHTDEAQRAQGYRWHDYYDDD